MMAPIKVSLPETEAMTEGDPDRPMDAEQRARLKVLCDQTGEEYDDSLTDEQAMRRIAALEEIHDLKGSS